MNGEECSWILSKDIIQSIEQFCDDNDAESPTKQMIGQTLARSGFSKKRSSEGPLYQMFGTNATKIMRPYVIRLEDMAVPYDEDSSSYIKEED